MSNPKVFEFAKEIGMTPLALMDKIKEWHIPVKNHMAELSPDILAQIKDKLSAPEAAPEAEEKPKKTETPDVKKTTTSEKKSSKKSPVKSSSKTKASSKERKSRKTREDPNKIIVDGVILEVRKNPRISLWSARSAAGLRPKSASPAAASVVRSVTTPLSG